MIVDCTKLRTIWGTVDNGGGWCYNECIKWKRGKGMKEAERILEITKYIAENIGEYDCSDAMGSYNEKNVQIV